MRLPFVFRVIAGALAAWLGLVLVDVPALHVCPMHDVPFAGASPGGHGASDMAAMAMPGRTPAAGAIGGPGAHARHVHGCTCLGACTPGAAALEAPAPPSLPAAALASAPGSLPLPPLPARGAGGHFLPFAQAPPFLA